MADKCISIRRWNGGVVVASAVAALVLSGAGSDALAAGDQGLLRLQLGAVNQFSYEFEGAAGPFQKFHVEGKGSCLMAWDAGGSELAILVPGGGARKDMPGMGYTSIGVYDGPNGTPCSRVSAYEHETLTFALGEYTKTSLGANAFDRLELDVEVKGNARLYLDVYLGGYLVRTYQLRSGSSVVPGEGTEAESNPSSLVFNCRARSDSGPDSGPSDNCRWKIADFGQAFTIRPDVGEFSWEGGGDWAGTPYEKANQSLIFLTHAEEGDLYCSSSEGPTSTGSIPIGDGGDNAVCGSVTRLPGTCSTPIHYIYRDIDGADSGCEFWKDPAGPQFGASVEITFPEESRTELAAVPDTKIQFPGATQDFTPRLCVGTVGLTTEGKRTIAEVLLNPGSLGINDGNDAVPGNGSTDWACILEHKVVYKGPLVDPKMQVIQTILFWGDPIIIRQGPSE